MAEISLEAINRELVSQFDATSFRPHYEGSYISTVRGRDGLFRNIELTVADMVHRSPLDLVQHIENMLIAASEAGAPKPFCLHCGREY